MSAARCECGRRRLPDAESCFRCAWLDGLGTGAGQDIISALRRLGGEATNDALEIETGLPERSLRRALAQLRNLRRIVTEVDRDEQNRNVSTARLRGGG